MLQDNERVFVYTEGKIQEIIKKSKKRTVILFDEINLTSTEVLSDMIELFDPNVESMKIKDMIFEKGDTMFICAMNPSLAKEGRSKLPELL